MGEPAGEPTNPPFIWPANQSGFLPPRGQYCISPRKTKARRSPKGDRFLPLFPWGRAGNILGAASRSGPSGGVSSLANLRGSLLNREAHLGGHTSPRASAQALFWRLLAGATSPDLKPPISRLTACSRGTDVNSLFPGSPS